MIRYTFLAACCISHFCFATDIFLQAEDAVLVGVNVSKSGTGFSGEGFITGFDNENDRIEFVFQAPKGLYELFIGFATPYGEKGYALTVNAMQGTGMFPFTGGTFSEHAAGKFQLDESENKIIIGKNWGWFYIDYIRLIDARIVPPLKPPKQLIDKNASASSQSMFSYLVDLFGRKVLSGQQDMEEIEYIESRTGKTPAIGVFDLIDYSPSRIQFGANPAGKTEQWISWAKTGGGIVSLSWHWNAPADLVNTSGKEWWRGFYTDATTFDLEAALADKNSERYQLLLRDMDDIAVQLRKFQNNDIPLLWRPLHEAQGGWFWWGAKGPEPFKELWRLMVERYTREHGLNNLIWVFTHADDPDWYPGDEYVDVVSMDIYTDASSSMSGEWENTLSLFNGKKLIALSESGTMPDPDKIRLYGVWWSWFSLWNGDFIRGVPQTLLKRTYNDSDVITLDELPDWRRYDRSIPDGVPETELAVYLCPNPMERVSQVMFVLPAAADVTLRLYNVLGQEVRSVFYGHYTAGIHYATIGRENLGSGVYYLQLQAGGRKVLRKVVVVGG
ncbi:T9SS type A sorting domain-containing protein [candidate division KSB1 bacterium]|nr:T9SS type A sorting domain-containing protein [candidate division KSB1 bacterium]